MKKNNVHRLKIMTKAVAASAAVDLALGHPSLLMVVATDQVMVKAAEDNHPLGGNLVACQ